VWWKLTSVPWKWKSSESFHNVDPVLHAMHVLFKWTVPQKKKKTLSISYMKHHIKNIQKIFIIKTNSSPTGLHNWFFFLWCCISYSSCCTVGSFSKHNSCISICELFVCLLIDSHIRIKDNATAVLNFIFLYFSSAILFSKEKSYFNETLTWAGNKISDGITLLILTLYHY
jgi:hypothetical protein